MDEVIGVELQRQYTEWMNRTGNPAAVWILPAWVDVQALTKRIGGGHNVRS